MGKGATARFKLFDSDWIPQDLVSQEWGEVPQDAIGKYGKWGSNMFFWVPHFFYTKPCSLRTSNMPHSWEARCISTLICFADFICLTCLHLSALSDVPEPEKMIFNRICSCLWPLVLVVEAAFHPIWGQSERRVFLFLCVCAWIWSRRGA